MEMPISEIWMTIVGFSMAMAGLPQIIRLIRRRSSDDVSLVFFLLIMHGQSWWVWYGWTKASPSIILSNIIGVAMSLVVIYHIIKFRGLRPALPPD